MHCAPTSRIREVEIYGTHAKQRHIHPADMDYLGMARDAFQAHINLAKSSRVDKVTVGAAIIRGSNANKEILLLKRNADEAYYPNVFEIPGGKVDENDPSIRHAIVREVAEETGLVVADVLSPLPEMRYITEKKTRDDAGRETIIQRHTMQLSYIVSVDGDGGNFAVNKEEHSIGIWADPDSLQALDITADMKKIILEALGRL